MKNRVYDPAGDLAKYLHEEDYANAALIIARRDFKLSSLEKHMEIDPGLMFNLRLAIDKTRLFSRAPEVNKAAYALANHLGGASMRRWADACDPHVRFTRIVPNLMPIARGE